MKTIKWSDLPDELRNRKTVNWSELPENFSTEDLPQDVTITALSGEALAESRRSLYAVTDIIGSRAAAAGLTDERIAQILNDEKKR